MKTTLSFPDGGNNENAVEAFLHHVASARELVTLLDRHLDDHMGLGPDEINWAHVGDANRFRTALQELADAFNLRPESTGEKAGPPKKPQTNDNSPSNGPKPPFLGLN